VTYIEKYGWVDTITYNLWPACFSMMLSATKSDSHVEDDSIVDELQCSIHLILLHLHPLLGNGLLNKFPRKTDSW
jgi:hypothetical protein